MGITTTVKSFDSLDKQLNQELANIEEQIKQLVNSTDDQNSIIEQFNFLNSQKKEILMDLQIWQLNRVFNN